MKEDWQWLDSCWVILASGHRISLFYSLYFGIGVKLAVIKNIAGSSSLEWFVHTKQNSDNIKTWTNRGAWVAQSVKRPTSARSQSRGPGVQAPRQALGWWLRAWSLFPILCLSLSLPLPRSCSVSLCPKNKKLKKKKNKKTKKTTTKKTMKQQCVEDDSPILLQFKNEEGHLRRGEIRQMEVSDRKPVLTRAPKGLRLTKRPKDLHSG